jgi:hypothetical protein
MSDQPPSGQPPSGQPPRGDDAQTEAVGERLETISSNLRQAMDELDDAARQRREALARVAGRHGIPLGQSDAPAPPAGPPEGTSKDAENPAGGDDPPSTG